MSTIWIVEHTAEDDTCAEAAFATEDEATAYVLSRKGIEEYKRDVLGGRPVGCWTKCGGFYGYYIRDLEVDFVKVHNALREATDVLEELARDNYPRLHERIAKLRSALEEPTNA